VPARAPPPETRSERLVVLDVAGREHHFVPGLHPDGADRAAHAPEPTMPIFVRAAKARQGRARAPDRRGTHASFHDGNPSTTSIMRFRIAASGSPERGAHVVGHVLRAAGRRRDRGDRRVARHELEEELRPARRADLARPRGQLLPAHALPQPPAPERRVDEHGDARSCATGRILSSACRSSIA
jgi:hypothetical protein